MWEKKKEIVLDFVEREGFSEEATFELENSVEREREGRENRAKSGRDAFQAGSPAGAKALKWE